LFPISPLLPALPRFKIVDVGAMMIGDGKEPFESLLRAVPCDVVGFEPVVTELEKLKLRNKEGHRFFPYIIGDGSDRTFYECNFPMTSSLLEPNAALLEKFSNLGELVRVVKTSRVKTRRLDDISEVKGADFLKVDVQGGEMLVFNGAIEMLNDVLVIQTEVEFVALYKGQPLFSDIDAFLRGRGFQYHRMSVSGRTFKPLIKDNDPNVMMSQQLWGDAIYVRDFMAFDQLAPLSLLKLAVILHESYGSFDLAALALEEHDRQTGSSLQPTYIKRLVSPGA
jgi:FkbM family methyltransferase